MRPYIHLSLIVTVLHKCHFLEEQEMFLSVCWTYWGQFVDSDSEQEFLDSFFWNLKKMMCVCQLSSYAYANFKEGSWDGNLFEVRTSYLQNTVYLNQLKTGQWELPRVHIQPNGSACIDLLRVSCSQSMLLLGTFPYFFPLTFRAVGEKAKMGVDFFV